jgi:flagellum-specific peptidoglycan hydrolase FlgJ
MATQQEQIDFVNKYGGYAGAASNRTGIPSTYILGQWALETGYGTHFAGDNNLGNIQGSAAKPYDYSSIEAGASAYADTILNPRYRFARNAETPEQFGALLKSAGYAADPNYASKIASVIKSITGLKGTNNPTSAEGGAMNNFMTNPLEFVKSKGLDVGFILVGGALIIFLLINATKSEIAKVAINEVL